MDNNHINSKLANLQITENSDIHQEPVLMVLKSHLHAENLLERLIVLYLPRADKLLEKAQLTF